MTHSSEELFNKIYERLEPRLNQCGIIRTRDAYYLCSDLAGYFSIQTIFKKIMDSMVELKKAEQQKNVQWIIMAPNTKTQ